MHRSITKKDYDILLHLDQKVYPTDNPVRPGILDQWYKHNPEFGLIFETGKKITGMLITIPLSKKGWSKLTLGKVEEANLKGDLIFNPKKDNAIGLHGYHIEKFTENKGFFEEAFTALKEVTKKIKKNVKILGFSGYAVTTEGISLAYNKLNMREKEYISNEHIMSKNGKLEVITKLTMKKLNKMVNSGYTYHNRCKMLITYPNEISLVWKYLSSK